MAMTTTTAMTPSPLSWGQEHCTVGTGDRARGGTVPDAELELKWGSVAGYLTRYIPGDVHCLTERGGGRETLASVESSV